MLAIRMQRTGRSGHAQFRVIVQDSRFSPTRGRVVSYLGSYNPHTKEAVIDSQKAAQYLQNGAQPSDTVARLFKKEGIKLPTWVKVAEPKKRDIRNPEKRRSTAPAQPETPAEEPAAEAEENQSQEPAETGAPAEEPTRAEEPAEEPAPAELAAEESAPAEEPAAEEQPEKS
jgi:small subunit ribosomal protein S16